MNVVASTVIQPFCALAAGALEVGRAADGPGVAAYRDVVAAAARTRTKLGPQVRRASNTQEVENGRRRTNND